MAPHTAECREPATWLQAWWARSCAECNAVQVLPLRCRRVPAQQAGSFASRPSNQPCCPSCHPQARPLHLRDRPAPRGPRVALLPGRRVLQVGRVGLVNQLARQAASYVEGGKTAGTRALPDVRWPPLLLNLCRCGTCTSIRRMADAIVINKANTAPHGSIDKLKDAAEQINPRARVRGLLAGGGQSGLASMEASCMGRRA